MNAPRESRARADAEFAASDATLRREALGYLASRVDYERTPPPPQRAFKLDRMRRLLELVGNPQDGLPIVHIAGTKGKGSTAAMIAAALTASGRRTGLFTSPHLTSVEERWKVDGRLAAPEEFASLVTAVREAAEPLDQAADLPESLGRPTFFEITTAMALLHFRRQRCDAAVLEVGLGGRLDSTNVCEPAITVITTISFDHMKLLGDTLAEIAGEKAGILKPGVPAVTGVLDREARDVIERTARQVGAPLFGVETDFRYAYRPPPRLADARETSGGSRPELDYWETHAPGRRLVRVEVGMRGAHQALNGAVALATLRRLDELGWNIGEEAMRRGLSEAVCPARVEILAGSPPVILDAAHNVASVEALVRVLDEDFAGIPGTLVFAASADKEVERMLQRLLPRFRHVYLTCFIENPRSVPPAELAQLAARILAPRGGGGANEAATKVASEAAERRPTWSVHERPGEAWERAKTEAAAGEFMCVAGSFFLVAELRPQVLRESLEKKINDGAV